MALLTGYSDANKQMIEPPITVTTHVSFEMLASIWYEFKQDVTTARYSYVGMTQAAAIACANALNDSANGVFAVPRWSAGGSYDVEVTEYHTRLYQEPVT
jgi:hypothetical protein